MIVRATGAFCDDASRADVGAFFDAHPVAGVERTLRQAIESIDRCTAFRAQHRSELTGFLSRRTPAGP